MLAIGLVETGANRADHTVHHSAGSDHVGSGSGMTGGLPGEQFERGVVVDVDAGGRFGQHAAVAVIGVLAKADVGDYEYIGSAFGGLDGALDDSLIAVGIASHGIFRVGNAEQDHSAQAQCGSGFDFFGHLVG